MSNVIANWIMTRFPIVMFGAILGYVLALYIWPRPVQLLIAFAYLCVVYKLAGLGIWKGFFEGLFILTAAGFIARWFYGVQLFLPY